MAGSKGTGQGPGAGNDSQLVEAATWGRNQPTGLSVSGLGLPPADSPLRLILGSAATLHLPLCIRCSEDQECWPHCLWLISLSAPPDQLMLTSSRQPSWICLYPSQPDLSRHTPLIQAPVILASNDLLLWPLSPSRQRPS